MMERPPLSTGNDLRLISTEFHLLLASAHLADHPRHQCCVPGLSLRFFPLIYLPNG